MANTLIDQIPYSEFELFLEGLNDLGISLENKLMLQQLFSMYSRHSFSVEDCVELAFARLRADYIEILCPAGYQAMFPVLETSKQGNEEEQKSDTLSAIQKRLFEELGIIPPKLIMSPSERVQRLSVKINDKLWHLTLADNSSDTIVVDALYDTLAKHATQLLSIDDVQYRLARLYVGAPVLVQAVLASFTLGDITRTLREILRHSKSLLEIRLPLERLLDSSFAVPPLTIVS